MATSTFRELLSRELKGQIKKNSQEASLLTAVKQKALNLEYTISLRSDEELSEDTLAAIDRSAEERIDAIISDMLDGKTIQNGKSGKIKVDSLRGLRTKRGTFISAFNLSKLLQITLQEYVGRLMGHDGYLHYRTGRLANSAEILSIMEESNGGASIMFTYMTYPYATFEAGNKQGRPNKAPSDLIDHAITIALNDILTPESAAKLTAEFEGVDPEGA